MFFRGVRFGVIRGGASFEGGTVNELVRFLFRPERDVFNQTGFWELPRNYIQTALLAIFLWVPKRTSIG